MNDPHATPSSLTAPKSSIWFDKYDLSMLRLMYPLVAIVTIVATGYQVIIEWIRNSTLYFAQGAVDFPVQIPELQRPGLTYNSVTANIGIESPDTFDRLLVAVPTIVMAGAIVAACWLLYRIMNSIAAGRGFDHANVRRLRWLSLTAFVGGVLVPVLEMPSNLALFDLLPTEGVTISLPVSEMVMWLLIGASIAMIAQAFDVGNRLVDDVEGTI